MSDAFRCLWQQQEEWRRMTDPLGELRRHIDPLGDAYKQLGLGSSTLALLRREEEQRKLQSGIVDLGGVAKIAADAERQRKLLEGSIEEARQLGVLDPSSGLRQSINKALKARDLYARMFRLLDGLQSDRVILEGLTPA